MEKIFIARKRVKNLNIRITRDGQVHVTAPLRMSDADIESILDRKRGWIESTAARMLEKARLRPQNFESGETLRVLGKPFRLRVEEGGTPGVAISGGEVVLTMRPGQLARAARGCGNRVLPRDINADRGGVSCAVAGQDRLALPRMAHKKDENALGQLQRCRAQDMAERVPCRRTARVHLRGRSARAGAPQVPGHGVDFKAIHGFSEAAIDAPTDTDFAMTRCRN